MPDCPQAAFGISQVREGEGLRRWRNHPDIQAKIENTLIAKADGMFRWAACQVEILKKCLDLRTLNEALHQLPKTLNETYARMLRDIPPEYKKQAIRLLQLLLYSQWPLRLDEMVDALAVNIEEDSVNTFRFDKEHRMLIPAEITLYCPGLVVYTQKPKARWERYGNAGEIKLAHLSVKEYLTTACDDNDFAELIGEAVANMAIAEVCLTYLLEIPAALFKNGSPYYATREYSFLIHSARQWVTSARTTQSPTSQVLSLTEKLFSKSEHVHLCLKLDVGSEEEAFDPEQPLHLYYASCFGIGWFVKALLEQGAKTHEKGGMYGNALQAAAAIGSIEVAELLIDRGADVNAHGGYFGNALQAAAAHDYKEIVELLVAQGADVNAHGGYYGNALQAAAATGGIETMELLFTHGADVNAQGGFFGNALQAAAAAAFESEEAAELLIDPGADVNACGGYYGNALQATARKGDIETVELLLARGAHVNTQGGYFGNALQAAAAFKSKEVAELLIDRGADVNACGGYYGNALQAAAHNRSIETVELLLGQGAVVNAQCGHYGTALQAAADAGSREIMELLLSQGANINAKGGIYSNALHAAAASVGESDKTIDLLLTRGGRGQAYAFLPYLYVDE